jgi:hypothetical protein
MRLDRCSGSTLCNLHMSIEYREEYSTLNCANGNLIDSQELERRNNDGRACTYLALHYLTFTLWCLSLITLRPSRRWWYSMFFYLSLKFIKIQGDLSATLR